MRKCLMAVSTMWACACGPASINGAVLGDTMDVADAIAVPNVDVAGLNNSTVILDERADLCAAPSAQSAGSASLSMTFYARTLDAARYRVVSAFADIADHTVMVQAARTNSDCQLDDDRAVYASTGDITIEAWGNVDGSVTRGRLSVVVRKQAVDGTFGAAYCAVPAPRNAADGCGDAP